MAQTSSHHNPSSKEAEKERDNAFLQTVNGTDDKDNGSSSNKGGRNPMPTFDTTEDPREEDEFAFSAERIEENYPFFGTLMMRQNGLMKRQEVIPKDKPRTIDYVQDRYGAGAFQLRQKMKGGEEQKINFNVSGIGKPNSAQDKEQQNGIDEKFIADLRQDLKKEIRSDYKDLIERLEKRLEARNDELDELSRKNRRLLGEIAEMERKNARNAREDQKEYEQKIDSLKDEKRDLEFEVFELEQELKYADAEQGFDIKSLLKDAANDPNVRQVLAPILAKIFGGGQPVQQQPQASLNGQRANPQQPSGQQENGQSQQDPEAGMSDQQQESNQQSSQQQNPQQQMQQLVEQFKSGVIQTVASSMANGQPEASQVKKLVMSGLNELENNGINPEPGMWVQIAKQLVDFAVQKSITAEKAAQSIKPVLEQLDGAADNLKYVPAKGAAKALINYYNIQVNEQQKDFLIDVLGEFKQQLTNAE